MQLRLQRLGAIAVALGLVGKFVAPRAGGPRCVDEFPAPRLEEVAFAARLIPVACFLVPPVKQSAVALLGGGALGKRLASHKLTDTVGPSGPRKACAPRRMRG